MGFSTRWRILGWKRDQDWCIDLQYDSAKCLTTAVFMFFTYFGIDWDLMECWQIVALLFPTHGKIFA